MLNSIQAKAADSFVAFHGYSAAVCKLRNTSSVSIDYRVGGTVAALAAGASAVIDSTASTSEVEVRRADLSATPVSVMLDFGVTSDEAYELAAAATAAHATAPAAHATQISAQLAAQAHASKRPTYSGLLFEFSARDQSIGALSSIISTGGTCGLVASQPTASRRPIVTDTSGRREIVFSSTGQTVLSCNLVALDPTEATFVIVGRASAGTSGRVLSKADAFSVSVSSGVAKVTALGVADYPARTTTLPTTPSILVATCSATDGVSYFLNGAFVGKQASGSPAPFPVAATRLIIGGRADCEFFDGAIEYVAAYDNALTTSEVAELSDWLGVEYGIGTALNSYTLTADNALEPLTTATYDGSGQVIHPSVITGPFGGYKYWMGATPYPSSNPAYENPSIWVSDDLVNWNVPPGLTNPVFPAPGGGNNNSDACLVLGPTGILYLYWRAYGDGYEKIFVSSSTDGIAWEPAVEVVSSGGVDNLSPAILWDGAEWKMWTCGTARRLRTASNPLGPWSSPEEIVIEGPGRSVANHLDVKLHNGFFCATVFDGTDISLSFSKDGRFFTGARKLLSVSASGFDRSSLYKATTVFTNAGPWIIYSGQGGSAWRVGLSKILRDSQ